VETAFLEAQPGLAEAVARLAGSGATRILVVPYFLTLGIHLQRDLPAIVEQLAQAHQNVEIRITPPLDGHPALATGPARPRPSGLLAIGNKQVT
jgi:sirohydrochlorin ferrochelatase